MRKGNSDRDGCPFLIDKREDVKGQNRRRKVETMVLQYEEDFVDR